MLLRPSSLHGHMSQTISLSVDGRLRCFQLGAIMNKAVCSYSCTRFCAEFPVLLKKVPQSEIPGSHGKCPYKLRRSHQILLQCAVSYCMGFSSGSVVKNLPASAGDVFNPWVRKILLEKEMATHPIYLAWILWTEEPGELQSIGLQKSQTPLRD